MVYILVFKTIHPLSGMGFPPVLVLLSVAVTATVAADPPVYCQVENNEYYMRQWGQCKACDRCPYGFGLNSKIVSFLIVLVEIL